MHACLISHGQIIRISNLKLSTLFRCHLFIFFLKKIRLLLYTILSYLSHFCVFDIRVKNEHLIIYILWYFLSFCIVLLHLLLCVEISVLCTFGLPYKSTKHNVTLQCYYSYTRFLVCYRHSAFTLSTDAHTHIQMHIYCIILY